MKSRELFDRRISMIGSGATSSPVSDQSSLPNTILTVTEIAAELRCSKAQVYKLMNGSVKERTVLPHIALGRKRVVRRSSFEAWKAANETATIRSTSEMEAVGAAD